MYLLLFFYSNTVECLLEVDMELHSIPHFLDGVFTGQGVEHVPVQLIENITAPLRAESIQVIQGKTDSGITASNDVVRAVLKSFIEATLVSFCQILYFSDSLYRIRI